MKTRLQRTITTSIFVAVMLFLSAVRADAVIGLQVSASQDGFQLGYTLPFMNLGNVNLENINDESELHFHISVIRLISIKLSLTAINPDATPPSLTVHFELIGGLLSRFLPDPLPQGDIPVPFLEAGVQATLFGKIFKPLGNHDVDASLLLTRHTTRYGVDVAIPLLQDSWEGEATPDNNTISDKVTINGQEIADIQVTLDYTSSLFTTASYSITLTSLMVPDDIPADNATITPITGGPIPLPNGSYRIWYNSAN